MVPHMRLELAGPLRSAKCASPLEEGCCCSDSPTGYIGASRPLDPPCNYIATNSMDFGLRPNFPCRSCQRRPMTPPRWFSSLGAFPIQFPISE